MSTKLIVFDVNNAACSLAVCPNGNGLMVDCGSHSEKGCPVDFIKGHYSNWLGMKPYKTISGKLYPLSLLHITHPDDDHVRNAKKVKEALEPYLVRKREYEEFPRDENIHEEYKELIDKRYRGKNPETISWGFDPENVFFIKMDEILKSEDLSKKVKNNSSMIRLIRYGGKKILFGGDLETEGWEWLAKNDQNFINAMQDGVDILIAPHHGHKSGFPTALFDLAGDVDMVILSKASESEKDDTDVSTRYAEHARGVKYKSLKSRDYFFGKTLTTRSNGDVFVEIGDDGSMEFFAEKASSNHEPIIK